MEYQVRTLHQSQKFEDISHNDREFTVTLNAFSSQGYLLDRVILDDKYVSERDAKKVYVLVFKRQA